MELGKHVMMDTVGDEINYVISTYQVRVCSLKMNKILQKNFFPDY